MSITVFTTLLTMCSIVTSLVTEVVKKLCKKPIAINIVVICLSLLIGGGVCIAYYILQGICFNPVNILYVVFMILANFFGATVGYDKVKQSIEQIVNCKNKEVD